MTTVALIIIVLIVLAGVAIFFFQYFTKSQGGVDAMTCFQLCQTEKAKYQDNDAYTPTKDTSRFCIEGCNNTYGNCSYGGGELDCLT